MRRRNRKTAKLGIILALLLCIAIVFVLLFLREQKQRQQARGTMSEGFGQRKVVSWNGQNMAEKLDLDTFLMMGIDRTSTEMTGYRNGGQADVLILAVLDHGAKKISLLQLDRDTMAMVTTLGVLGDYAGLHRMQISLSHGYGADQQECNRHTVEAVSRLLDGIPIEGYMAMDLSNITALNHVLGGVTVTIEDDFTAYDAGMAPGATVTLTDSQAELFLHSRMSIGDGKNTSRMRRHRAYLEAAVARLRQKTSEDASFVNVFAQEMQSISNSDVAYGRMINELNRVYHYEIEPIETLKGEHGRDDQGFTTFEADPADITRWVMTHLYEPA